MSIGIACSIALSAHLAVGGLGLFDCLKKHRHGRDEHAYAGPECCDDCRSEAREVRDLVRVMRGHPSWKRRDDAAHDLREFDWRRHPELAPALAAAMLEDPHEEVREEAAESLADLAPLDGIAHVALRQAALADPDDATREQAREALDRLDHRCLTDCALCGPPPGPGGEVVAAPLPAGWGLEEGTSSLPGIVVEPPADWPAPAIPPGAFGGALDVPTGPPRPEFPALPDPGARPGLLPPALTPDGGPVEVLPPELPPAPAGPPPFGAFDRRGDPGRPVIRAGLPARMLPVGRPR